MNNWSSGWRRLIVWDDTNKYYLYKDRKILPLDFIERQKMPLHLQNEYYWDEIERIDAVIDSNNRIDSKPFDYNNSAQKAFDDWWKMVEEEDF